MSQIKTHVLKQGNPSKHVLSCGIFKMIGGGYRDFSKYESQFKRFLEQKRNLKNFETRVYVDNTTAELITNLVKDDETVTVIHYDCKEFREGEGHAGVFGTFPRFLPLFEEGLETVWISDIDLPNWCLQSNILTLMKKKECYAMAENRVCYERRPFSRKYTFVAFRMIFRVTFQKALLTRFLNRVLDGKEDEMVKRLNEVNRDKPEHPSMPYGMDEVFINTSIYNSLQKHNIRSLFHRTFYINYNLLKEFADKESDKKLLTLFWMIGPTKELSEKVKKIYRKALPTIVEKQPCYKEIADKLESFKNGMEEYNAIEGQAL